MKSLRILIVASMAAVAITACSPTDDANSDARRGPIGKADVFGSCETSNCDGPAADGNCWCDELCTFFDDCCEDKVSVCDAPEPVLCGARLGDTCQADEYCHWEIGATCGWADGAGTCRITPEACIEIFAPVCGCDGNTYGNGCKANAAGVSILHAGECPPPTCGGIAGLQCPSDLVCVAVATDVCNPANGGADCGGICIDPPMCGGFAGFLCDAGFDCIDDPRDNCDPQNGGADCSGVCIKALCQPVTCEMFCPAGFQTDANGCEICVCNEPEPDSCIAHCDGTSEDGSCYCDDLCTFYGDCCADYAPSCPE